MDLPFLRWLYGILGWLLALFYSWIPNIGFAIFVLTLLIMLALFPLTAKQAKAMVKLQLVQPEIKAIQQKYKDDKAKQNEEVMRFYQENKINPFAGCLPLLFQMPFLVALFETIQNVQKWVPTDSKLYAAFCQKSVEVVYKGQEYIPKNGSVLLPPAACSGSRINEVDWLTMSVRTSPSDALRLQQGFWATLPYFIILGLVVVLGLLQGIQTQRTQVGQQPNTQMKVISRIMPVFFGVFSFAMPSGLILYFATSSAWRLGQQEVIYRRIIHPTKTAAEEKKAAAAAVDTSPPPTTGGTNGSGGNNRPTAARKRKKRR